MTPCEPGFYSLEDELVCTIAAPGTYAPVTTETPLNAADFNTANNKGYKYFSDIGMTYPELCTPGRECKDNTGRHMVTCPPGYFMHPTNYECTICEAGKYCPVAVGEVLIEGKTCADGTYSAEGYTECLPCKPGFSCPDKTYAGMTPCDAGKYQLGGSMSCTTCPQNHECNDDTRADPNGKTAIGVTIVRCPPFHYYDPADMDGNCKECPGGHECQGIAFPHDIEDYGSVTVSCGQGYYSRPLDQMCMPCPKGHSCPNNENEIPTACVGGTYADEGATTCTACKNGYYAKMGSEYCSPVPAGFQIVNADTNDETIEVCPQGTYSAWGMETC